MRFRYSSSAAAVVVLVALAGCGGGGGTVARPAAFPDPRGPLDAHAQPLVRSATSRLELVRFRGAGGSTVQGYLATSRKPGSHPGVVFLTGSGGTMRDLAGLAVYFANHGGVGLTIQQPPVTTSWAPLVENVRRALDFLSSRPGVDAKRLGVAGLSLGAETAAIVAGVDARPRAIALMSCRGGPVVLHYLRYADGDAFYVQDGRRDEVVPHAQLLLTVRAIDALHAPLQVRWYPTGHTLDEAAYTSQVDWLRRELQAERG